MRREGNVKPVGLLVCRNHPLLPYFLDRMENRPGVEPILIFDEKAFSSKDRRIFEERTAGAFPDRETSPFLKRYRWISVPDHNGEECRGFVRENRIGLLVNAGTPRRIRQELLEAAPIGILNVHSGILPKYRGATCCDWAIYHDEPVGVTAHFMNAGLDSGPILFSRELPVRKGQGYTEVHVALYRLEQEARVEAIRHILERNITSKDLSPQPEGKPFKPIPDDLLEVVKMKLATGEYRHAR